MLLAPDTLWILLGALALDAVIGDPGFIWRRVSHPVVLFGAVISALDRTLNRTQWSFAQRRAAGVLTLAVLLALSVGTGWLIERALRPVPGGQVLLVVLASVFLAQRSLYDHVAHVRDAFADGLPRARQAVSMIVGRDPESLDESGVSRAAIESCAENFSDGVVAPALWFALLGLPGLLAYKIVNTADSMIGHRSERYEAFGWAAARFDDLLNLIPARLSGFLVALGAPLVGGRPSHAIRIMLRDAGLHRSPNAGWPEAAMAASLGLALAGPRRYGDRIVDDCYLNAEGRSAAKADDIGRALKLLIAACVLHAALYAALALAF